MSAVKHPFLKLICACAPMPNQTFMDDHELLLCCQCTMLRLLLFTSKACKRCGIQPAWDATCRSLREAVQTYFLRWKGANEDHPPPPPWYRVSLFHSDCIPVLCIIVHCHCPLTGSSCCAATLVLYCHCVAAVAMLYYAPVPRTCFVITPADFVNHSSPVAALRGAG